jgi:hypothetical protein
MAITNGYATLSELKARLTIAPSDTVDDSMLEAVIESASRAIDRWCNRHFYQAVQTRYFYVVSSVLAIIDDCISVSAVATDRNLDRTWSTVITASQYELGPLSSPQYGLPYCELRIKPLASESFDLGKDMLQIAGTWGWSAIPDPVNEACLLLASRYFKRKDAPFGVTGGGDVGQAIAIRGVDPDVSVLLSGYRRIAITDLV